MLNFTENARGIELGYVCINLTLQKDKKAKVTCNRSMIRRTFDVKGIEYASELSRLNTRDILPILEWNHMHNIKVFRMTSSLFPWASEYMLEDLPDFEEISKNLAAAGNFAKEKGIRLSFHPGPFNILASSKDHVVKNAIVDLSIHGKIMDLMGMPRSHWAKINIHVPKIFTKESIKEFLCLLCLTIITIVLEMTASLKMNVMQWHTKHGAMSDHAFIIQSLLQKKKKVLSDQMHIVTMCMTRSMIMVETSTL